MKVATPKIDLRVFAQLLQEAKAKALSYTSEWSAAQEKDAGQALLKIYLRLYEGVIRQLNKTPEKNFIAFLDSLGMELQPAQSARAIVTFSLAEGTKEHVIVPKGTQLAAEGLDGEEAIFETDEPVRLTPALLQQVYSVDARNDEIYEHTEQFRNTEAFDLLAGPNKQEHALYIGHTDVLNQLNPSKITVEFTTTSGATGGVLELIWEYWNGERWVALRNFKPGGTGDVNDTTDLLSKSGTMIIEKPYIGEFAEKELRPNALEDSAKFKSRWLRCRVANKLSSTSQIQLPEVNTIRLMVTANKQFPPELAFNNDVPLNLEDKIKPFGELPALFDTFYIASDEAFSKKGATITLNVDSKWNDNHPKGSTGTTPTAVLSWEYWNGKSWSGLRVTDMTSKFKDEGTVSFTCPEDISKTEVNGEEKFWVRVRIVDGDYGRELIIEPVDPQKSLEVKISKGQIKYPIINELTVYYEDVPREPQYCVSFNNLDFEDHIEALRDQARSFQPFQILPEADPGVFLGFDKPLEGTPLRILFKVEEQSRSSDNPVKIQWSYWNGNSWAVINATDGTESLSRIGLLDLIVRNDFVAKELFDHELFWLKGSVIAGELTQPPQKAGELPQPTHLYGIFPNSVFATQVATVQDEPLGSSNGQATQSFSFLHPLIVSQEVFVRETVELTDEEKAQTIIEEGEEAITPERDETGEIVAYKIRWHQVDDFDDSTPKSRHYTMDKRLGIVTFGDGVLGMIPPPGADNIRANYKFGGGKKGNVEVGKIASLKNAIPFVSEVTNHLAAGGGSPTETLDEVLIRGPQTLKHRDRAMSSTDFEALARDASRSVARARCLMHTDENGEPAPGHITVVIVPDTQKEDEKPRRLLRDVVADSLKKKAANSVVAADHIHVTGASYVKLTVKPTIVPVSLNAAAQVEQDVLSALQRYIHPLTGGPCGSGWEFGKGICRSEIFGLLEGIKDVDHVADLKLSVADKEQDGDVTILPNQLMFSGEHKINFTLEERPLNGARKTLFSECLDTPNDKILDPEQCEHKEERVLTAH